VNKKRTKIYEQLTSLGNELSGLKISDLSHSEEEFPRNIKTDLINFDYSKQRVNPEALDFLLDIPDQLEVRGSLDSLFEGNFTNPSESRNVSHTIYRSQSVRENFEVIFSERKKIKQFLNQIKEDQSIKNIISIAIGGSRLGAELIQEFHSNTDFCKVYFCSSYDLIELNDALKSCSQGDTIVFVISKSFETTEILKNLDHIKSWFSEIPNIDFRNHLYGISSNMSAMTNYGIKKSNQFELLDSLGGRLSIWSSVSLPSFVNSDFENYLSLLEGAYLADRHTQSSSWRKNIPVIMALLSVFNSSLQINNHAIFTYNFRLRSLAKYVAQLSMESNGKSKNSMNEESPFYTSPLIWGGYGVEAQHSTFQWLMQGKTETSCDFIGLNDGQNNSHDSWEMLLSQVIAMSYGEEDSKNPFKSIKGNNPCSIIQLNSFTYKSLGFLLALYEHKVFVESLILGVDPYDQWGVQLGKRLALTSSHNKNFLTNFFDDDFISKS
jgi:glucose-6-phosphate isomerase